LRYWPKGHKKANETSCSAYVWAERAAQLQMKLYVNKKAKILDKDGPVHWRAGNDRGYADFSAIPDGEDVQLKVVLLQVESQAQQAPSSEEYESYEYPSDDDIEDDEGSEEETDSDEYLDSELEQELAQLQEEEEE